MRFFTLFLIGLFLIIFSNQSVLACRCSSIRPTCSQFSNADSVFIGRVEKVDFSAKSSTYSIIHFRIEQSFKGIKEETAKVGYVFGTSCSKAPDAFKPGEKWLVYGYKQDELLIIPFCTGSQPISGKSDNLEFIENFLKGKTKEYVFGQLLKGSFDGIKNGHVIVKRKNRTFKTITIETGLFYAQVPSEGIYRVKVTVPFKAEKPNYLNISIKRFTSNKNRTVLEYETKVEKGLCSFDELKFYEVDH